MESFRVSNLFTPAFSKRLIITSHSNLNPTALYRDNELDEKMSEILFHLGFQVLQRKELHRIHQRTFNIKIFKL